MADRDAQIDRLCPCHPDAAEVRPPRQIGGYRTHPAQRRHGECFRKCCRGRCTQRRRTPEAGFSCGYDLSFLLQWWVARPRTAAAGSAIRRRHPAGDAAPGQQEAGRCIRHPTQADRQPGPAHAGMNSACAICCPPCRDSPGGFTSAQRVQQPPDIRLGTRLAQAGAGSGAFRGNDEGTLSMWAFFSRRLRMWLLLAIALPLTRALVHRLALAAQRHDSSTRTRRRCTRPTRRSPPYPSGRPVRENAAQQNTDPLRTDHRSPATVMVPAMYW